MLRSVILAAARSPRVERLIETAPVTRDVVKRFVAGTGTDDALRATGELAKAGLAVSLDYLGEDTLTPEQAEATRDEYLHLLGALSEAELTPAAEVSVKLSALGQQFDEKLAYDHARAICAAASAGRHHGDTRHGGSRHDRLHPGHPQQASGRLSDDRRGIAGLPAPHRGRLPRAGRVRVAGATLQGGVQGAGDGGLPVARWTWTSRTCVA